MRGWVAIRSGGVWSASSPGPFPTVPALEWIATHCPRIVEIGAGNGYWAWMLTQYGCDVIAYDIAPTENDWVHGSHYPVLEGGTEKAALHPDRALMLCWPPHSDPMAFDALSAYQGDTLIYIGESSGGCTGDENFFRRLGCTLTWVDEDGEYRDVTPSSEWTLLQKLNIPQWEGIHDAVYVYQRRTDEILTLQGSDGETSDVGSAHNHA